MDKIPSTWSGFIFLLREGNGIKVTGQCPSNIEIDEEEGQWSFGGHPPFRIGENSTRLHYSEVSILGVFRARNLCHIKNMIDCYDFHLRKLLGEQKRASKATLIQPIADQVDVELPPANAG